MKSVRGSANCESICPASGSFGRSASILCALAELLAPALFAQPVAGSITSHALPFPTSSVFIDASANVYTTGASTGSGVTAGAAQTQPGGGTCFISSGFGPELPVPCTDAYIAKADPTGKIVFGTLLGGPTEDGGSALAVDGAGNVFVAGVTGGSFPTTPNAAIATSTTSTTFAAKLSADGSHFLYVTYLPDTAQSAQAIAVDTQGNAYVGGQTKAGQAYIIKVNSTGSAFLYNVTLAGSAPGAAAVLLVDADGNLLVAGETSSTDFPVTPGVVQGQLAGAQNLFITKLNPSGGILFATYLGGSGNDTPTAIQTDSAGNLYVAGFTTSLDFGDEGSRPGPIAGVPLWNGFSPGGFVASLSPDASTIRYSAYVQTVDNINVGSFPGVTSLAVTAGGEAYVAGATGAGFATTASAPQICFHGPWDAFVEHLDANGLLVDATYAGGAGTERPQGLAVESDGSVLLQTTTFPLQAAPSASANGTIEQIQFGSAGWTAPACLSPNPANAATLWSDGSLAPGEFVSLIGFGIGPDAGVAYSPTGEWQPPLELAGVQVFFDGQPAPLLYVQSRQVNVQAPFELAGETQTTVQLQYNGSPVGSFTAPVNYAAPGIFRSPPGVSTEAAATNQDGTVNSPSNPAAPGSIVSIWGTGFGTIDPPCATGGLNPFTAVDLTAGASVVLDACGDQFTAVYAGSAPGMACGVEQINFAIPTSAHGVCYVLASVDLTSGGAITPFFGALAGATIAVQ